MTDEVLARWTQQVMMEDVMLTERQLELHVQPKPRWLPMWLWRRLFARLIVLREVRGDG